MKKFFLLIMIILFCVGKSQAQLKVSSEGKVGIKVGNSLPLSDLTVGGVGDEKAKVSIENNNRGLVVRRKGDSPASWAYATITSSEVTPFTKSVGLSGLAYSYSPINSGRAWGVFGIAGNSTNGYNYGVFGTTLSGQNGAGIVGTSNNTQDVNVPGHFAGYFVGDVRVDGGVLYATTVVPSDIRFKKNVKTLQLTNKVAHKKTLNNLLEINPVVYNLNKETLYPTKSVGDTVNNIKMLKPEKSPMIFQKKHYGLIAQELQKIYPDLVYEDDNGLLGVNYTGLIPILIQSIKELKQEVDYLHSNLENLKIGNAGNTIIQNDIRSTLYQNTPNPFSQSTEIKYYLPKEVNEAILCIYDMQGKQLKQIPIDKRGEGTQIIHASEFTAGIYLYALITDGNEVDVKRMVLTE